MEIIRAVMSSDEEGSCLDQGYRKFSFRSKRRVVSLDGVSFISVYIFTEIVENHTIRIGYFFFYKLYFNLKKNLSLIHCIFNFLMTFFWGGVLFRMLLPSVPWGLGQPLESPYWTTRPATRPLLPERAVNSSASSRKTSRHYGR